jgi:hypothetical protein
VIRLTRLAAADAVVPPALQRYEPIVGPERATLARDLKRQYEQGRSIRDLASQYDRSYGFIHRMLVDAKVRLRGRGGDQWAKNRGRA